MAPRVLFVDDNEVNSRLGTWLLRENGFEVAVAGDGREALEAYATGRFDVIVMDLQMPVMDGLAAAAEIRRREVSTGVPHLPIIAVSASAVPSDRAHELAAFDLHLTKPVRGDAMVAAIRRTLAGESDGSSEEAPSSAGAAGALDAPRDPRRRGGVDLAALRAHTGGDPRLQRLVSEQCLGRLPLLLADLRDAAATTDAERLARAAHAIKGTAGLFGAVDLAEAAARLETLARAATLGEASEELTTVEQYAAIALRGLAALLDAPGVAARQ